jgi:hypothetical protein
MSAVPAAFCSRLSRRERTGAAAGSACRRGDRGPGKAHGAVTAEFAVALPAVLLLLAMLLAGVAAGVTQLRLEEAARAGARALARGENAAAVEGIVRTLAGASAATAVAADGEWLSVTVADKAGGPWGSTVPWTLSAKASTRSESASALQGPRQPTLPRPDRSRVATVPGRATPNVATPVFGPLQVVA